MSETSTPGMQAHHSWITDECRANRTDEGAFDEAVRRMRVEYDRCVKAWRGKPGVKFHIVLTIERP